MENFKQGDVVYLKSGSPAMTIECERKSDSKIERLIFFDGSQLKHAEIINELLTYENPNFKTLESFAEPLNKFDIEDEVGKQLLKIFSSCINDSELVNKNSLNAFDSEKIIQIKYITLKEIIKKIEHLNFMYSLDKDISVFKTNLEIEHHLIVSWIEYNKLEHLFEYSTKPNGTKKIYIK